MKLQAKKIYGERKINKKKIKRLRFDWAKILKKSLKNPNANLENFIVLT